MFAEFLPALAWLLFVSFSLGFALTREKSLPTFGFGIAAFCVLSVIFNLFHVPLSWLIFLAIAIAIMAYFIWKKELGLSLPKVDGTVLIVLGLALLNFAVYWIGATAYPWLEDMDPWLHTIGTDWVAVTQSFSRFYDGTNFYRLYIEPYPPSFDILMGVLHQMTPSVSTTLKFFNAFLVSLSPIFAFYAVSEITKSRNLALLAAFFLLAMPAFMSHFIWAQTLAMLMLLISFYAYERALKEPRFLLPAGVAVGAVAISQPSTAAIFAIMSVLYALAKFYENGLPALKQLAIIGAIGLLLAGTYYVPTVLKYGVEYTGIGLGMFPDLFTPGSSEDFSDATVYGIADYFIVQPDGRIDQHIGIGIVLGILALLGFAMAMDALRKGSREAWLSCAALWLILGILGTEGNIMPVKLFPHRFWVFLAIPVAILAAYAYLKLEEKWPQYKALLFAGLVLGVLATSAAGKLNTQTSIWPPGLDYASQAELSSYLGIKMAFPEDTRVFTLCSSDLKITGNDMLAEPWLPEYGAFKRHAPEKSPTEVYAFLKKMDYPYLVLDQSCAKLLGNESAAQLPAAYNMPDKADLVMSEAGFTVFRLK